MKTRRIVSLMGSKPGVPGAFVNKIVVYDNNGKMIDCKPIEKDDKGHEYYYPDNPHGLFGLFSGCIKDAIESIKDGKGDVIAMKTNSFSPSSVRVIRYIDREYGEYLRQQSIEGWKDTKFGYAVYFGWLNSFGSYVLCKDNTPFLYGNPEKILTFDKKEDADKYISDIEKTAKKYYDEYKSLDSSDSASHKIFFNKMESEGYGKTTIMFDLLIGLEDSKNNEPTYKIKTVQHVLK